MPLAGLIVNRVHRSPAAQLSAARSLAAAETLESAPTATLARPDAGSNAGATAASTRYPLASTALRLHAERMQLGERERRLEEHFTAAHPVIPVVEVPAQPEDVHDLDGLRAIGVELARAADGEADD